MARIHGKDGALYMDLTGSGTPEPVTFLNAFTIDMATDRVEVTAFEDANKTFVSGKESFEGTYGGYWDNATQQFYSAATDGASRKFYLYPDKTVLTSGPYFFGSAFFDFSLSSGVGQAVQISGSFSAAGDISQNGIV